MRLLLLPILLMSACATDVVVQREAMQCVVPSAATVPVPIPEKLKPGATNEDMFNRMGDLEARLEKCNGRLADVPQTVTAEPVQKESESSIRERLRSLLKTRKESKT